MIRSQSTSVISGSLYGRASKACTIFAARYLGIHTRTSVNMILLCWLFRRFTTQALTYKTGNSGLQFKGIQCIVDLTCPPLSQTSRWVQRAEKTLQQLLDVSDTENYGALMHDLVDTTELLTEVYTKNVEEEMKTSMDF